VRVLHYCVLSVALLWSASSAVAQPAQARTQVELSAYAGLTQWEGEGPLLGGGLQFESPASRHMGFYADLGIATVVNGCATLEGARCPTTYWHVLGGIRFYPLSASHLVRPYLSAATGPMRLTNSGSLLRAEAGAIIQARVAWALHLAVHHSVSFTGAGPRLWGGIAGCGSGCELQIRRSRTPSDHGGGREDGCARLMGPSLPSPRRGSYIVTTFRRRPL
jgi:hypothetical protein